jgi:hypothetical protein
MAELSNGHRNDESCGDISRQIYTEVPFQNLDRAATKVEFRFFRRVHGLEGYLMDRIPGGGR